MAEKNQIFKSFFVSNWKWSTQLRGAPHQQCCEETWTQPWHCLSLQGKFRLPGQSNLCPEILWWEGATARSQPSFSLHPVVGSISFALVLKNRILIFFLVLMQLLHPDSCPHSSPILLSSLFRSQSQFGTWFWGWGQQENWVLVSWLQPIPPCQGY